MEGQDKKITVSEQIRQYYDIGMKVKDIAKELGIRYQFAYNVISVYLKEQEFAAKNETAAGSTVIPVQPTPPPQPAPQPQPEPQPLTLQPFSQTKPEEPLPLRWGDAPKTDVDSKKNVLARLFQKDK